MKGVQELKENDRINIDTALPLLLKNHMQTHRSTEKTHASTRKRTKAHESK